MEFHVCASSPLIHVSAKASKGRRANRTSNFFCNFELRMLLHVTYHQVAEGKGKSRSVII